MEDLAKSQQKNRRSPLKWVILTVYIVVLAGLVSVLYYHYNLNPKQHFASRNIPVVSAPASKLANNTKDEQFNVLLLGSDERNADQPSRTDSIMVVHVNVATNTYSVLSIPRDTRINLAGYGETKIAHASYMGGLTGGSSGAMKSILDAVSNLTGLPINYYAETNYQGLQNMVDAVGGVDVTVPYRITLTHPWYPEDQGKVFDPGIYHLDGKLATEVVHERYSLQNGDFGRQETQELVLLAIMKKAMHPSNVSELPKLIEAAHGFLINTNMSTQDMLSLGLALKGLNTNDIHYYQLTGTSIYATDPIVKSNLSYFVPDMAQLKAIIEEHFQS